MIASNNPTDAGYAAVGGLALDPMGQVAPIKEQEPIAEKATGGPDGNTNIFTTMGFGLGLMGRGPAALPSL